LDYPDFRIVVIDNGSSDDSWDRIKGWASGNEPAESHYVAHRRRKKPLKIISYSKVEAEAGGMADGEALLSGTPSDHELTLIQSGANRGYAGGCNIGIRYALKRGAEYLWLLNNDTVVHPRALSEMVALAASDKNVGSIGSVLYDFNDPGFVQAYGGGSINWWLGTSRYLKEPGKGRLDYLTGASLLIKRPVVESVGLLDESYFFYWEDVAYGQRVLRAGWKISVAEGSRILHKEGGTVSGEERLKSLASDLFMVRSTILFFSNYGGVRGPLAIFLRLWGIVVNRLRRKQPDRILPLLKVAVATCREVGVLDRTKCSFRGIARRAFGMDKSG
jgi:GT2 family glycosyltransferase